LIQINVIVGFNRHNNYSIDRGNDERMGVRRMLPFHGIGGLPFRILLIAAAVCSCTS
jgi:hypothetical protein